MIRVRDRRGGRLTTTQTPTSSSSSRKQKYTQNKKPRQLANMPLPVCDGPHDEQSPIHLCSMQRSLLDYLPTQQHCNNSVMARHILNLPFDPSVVPPTCEQGELCIQQEKYDESYNMHTSIQCSIFNCMIKKKNGILLL